MARRDVGTEVCRLRKSSLKDNRINSGGGIHRVRLGSSRLSMSTALLCFRFEENDAF